jgi:murein DD-endopeptidase MepM/ murein hydrolase activator NlpD
MAKRVYTPGAMWVGAIIATFFLLPCESALVDQASSQPNPRQMEQQRREQAEARRALEESERRVAASQAEQIREAQERSEQQRHAFAEANRKREAEQHYEEFLSQARARAQQSNRPAPLDEGRPPQMSPEPAAAPLQTSVMEPQLRRYFLVRQAGFVLMIGASLGALLVFGCLVREWLAR